MRRARNCGPFVVEIRNKGRPTALDVHASLVCESRRQIQDDGGRAKITRAGIERSFRINTPYLLMTEGGAMANADTRLPGPASAPTEPEASSA